MNVESYIDSIDLSTLTPRQRARFEVEVETQKRLAEETAEELAQRMSGASLFRDEPLAQHTVLGVGGAADALVEVNAVEALKEALAFAEERGVAHMVIGRGSSILVRDGGFRGMVIKLGERFREASVEESGEDVFSVRAGGSMALKDLARFMYEKGCAVPSWWWRAGGTVAGSLMMHAERLIDVVLEMTVVERSGREMSLKRKAFVVGDKPRMPRNAVITSVVIALEQRDQGTNELPCAANDDIGAGALRGVFKDIGKRRAAVIIDEAGLSGVRVGRMRVGSDDANTFINEGSARARDALVLIGMIKDRVKQAAGVSLETAAKIVGEN